MVKMSKRIEECIKNTIFTPEDEAANAALTKFQYEEPEDFEELIQPGEFDHLNVQEVQQGFFLKVLSVLHWSAHISRKNIKKLLSS